MTAMPRRGIIMQWSTIPTKVSANYSMAQAQWAKWHWQVMNDLEHVLASGVAESNLAARNAVVLQCLQRLATIPDPIR
jgi:hypothetical protein